LLHPVIPKEVFHFSLVATGVAVFDDPRRHGFVVFVFGCGLLSARLNNVGHRSPPSITRMLTAC
jgi:hypothetical protein